MKRDRLKCGFCQSSEESEITGPLLNKEDVVVHQNCLFYSSNIVNENTPYDDDLMGFLPEHVEEEIRRGSRLKCAKCRRSGATVGCEVKRCKKSYHYPCALEDGAQIIEDADKGIFQMYCKSHKTDARKEDSDDSSDSLKVKRPRRSKAAAAHRNRILIEDDNSSSSDENSFEHYQAPLDTDLEDTGDLRIKTPVPDELGRSSQIPESEARFGQRDTSDEPRPSTSGALQHQVVRSANGPASEEKTANSPPASEEKTANSPPASEEKTANSLPVSEEKTANSPPASEEKTANSPPAVEEKTVNSPPAVEEKTANGPDQLSRPDIAKPRENQEQEDMSHLNNRDADVTDIDSDQDSMSLLLPVKITQVRSINPDHSGVAFNRRESPQAGSGGGPGPSKATEFWQTCREAGCVETIFHTFISAMNAISERILSEKASEEDCSLSLRVLEASGMLPEIFAQKDREYEDRLQGLQRETEAVKKRRTAAMSAAAMKSLN